MPEFVAVARINGPGVVGRGEIEDAVDFEDGGADVDAVAERAGFARAFAADNDGGRGGAEAAASAAAAGSGSQFGDPGQSQILDVRLIDLSE